MYWIYLFLFVCIIFTPEVVTGSFFFLNEEAAESVFIFAFGLVGLLLYLGKESALIRTIAEKLSLQQESNKIRKDLAQSYGYIGEMNRHLEILKNAIVESPHTVTALTQADQTLVYGPVFDATLLLAQSDAAALFFVDKKTGAVLVQAVVSDQESVFASLTGEFMLNTKKYWWQTNELTFVRSNEDTLGVAAFLVFRSPKNRIEEIGVFQILVTHALLLFSLGRMHSSQSTLAL